MLTAAVKTLSNATEEAVAQIAQAGDVHRQPTLLGNRSGIQITMMDPNIIPFKFCAFQENLYIF